MRLKAGRLKAGLAVWAAVAGAVAVSAVAQAAVTRISFWTWYTDPSMRVAMDGLVKDFMKENPNIKVTHSIYDFASIQDKYLTSVVGGAAPEVTLVSSRWMVQMAAAEAFVPLEPLMTRDKMDAKDIYKNLWPGVQYKGKIYAIPFAGGNQQAMWYNQDKFAEVGLDPKTSPRTWSELVAAARKLTRDRNADNKIDEWGIDSSLYFPSMLLANGGEWIKPDGSQVLWNSEKGVEALQFIVDMWSKYKVVNSTWGTSFEGGKAAMHLEGPYQLARYRKLAKFKFGLGIHPQNDGMKDIRMWASSDSLALAKKPKDKMEAGWKLIKFLMKPEHHTKWAMQTGFPVMTQSARQYPAFKKALADDPLLEKGNDLMAYATAFPPCIKDKDLEPLMAEYQNTAISGKMSPKQALDRAVDQANRWLARLKKK